jgi:hypothetical protein
MKNMLILASPYNTNPNHNYGSNMSSPNHTIYLLQARKSKDFSTPVHLVNECFASDAAPLVIHDSDKRRWTSILKHFICIIRYCRGLCDETK